MAGALEGIVELVAVLQVEQAVVVEDVELHVGPFRVFDHGFAFAAEWVGFALWTVGGMLHAVALDGVGAGRWKVDVGIVVGWAERVSTIVGGGWCGGRGGRGAHSGWN